MPAYIQGVCDGIPALTQRLAGPEQQLLFASGVKLQWKLQLHLKLKKGLALSLPLGASFPPACDSFAERAAVAVVVEAPTRALLMWPWSAMHVQLASLLPVAR
jgi:hypothetical protein